MRRDVKQAKSEKTLKYRKRGSKKAKFAFYKGKINSLK
jgi:hypothetical protein